MDKLIEIFVSLAFANETEKIKSILEENPNIDLNENSQFIGNICANNNIELLSYLLESEKLKYPINIHLDTERALCCAIYGMDGQTNLEIVKYLLTSKTLKEHSILPSEKYNLVYYNIFKLKMYKDSLLMIDYLTLEYAVEKKDENIYILLLNHSDDNELNDQIIKNLMTVMIEEKDLNYKSILEYTFKNILLKYDFTLKVLDYLTLEYASEKKDIKIYELLANKKYSKNRNEIEQLKNNLIILIEKEKDDSFKIQLEQTLCKIDKVFYEKYKLNRNLNKELSLNSNRALKKL